MPTVATAKARVGLLRRLRAITSGTPSVSDDDFFTDVRDSLDRWDDRRLAVSATRTDTGPLPLGWKTLAETVVPLDPSGNSAYHMRLVQHPTGGWVLAYGLYEHDEVMPTIAHQRFDDFYTSVIQYADGTHPGDPLKDQKFWKPAEQMVHRFIVARYNIADPAEAAEQMVVALGARASRLPATLTG